MTFRTSMVVLAVFLAVGGQAFGQIVVYSALLDGPSEAPPNASPGLGTSTVTVDFGLLTMRVQASFSGLLSNTTNAHIHCCTTNPMASTAGVATPTPTFPGFPSGVTAGAYDMTFDMTQATSYNGAFITSNGGTPATAFTALIAGFDARKAYFNLHSTQFPGGEIRGFLVPEPTAATACMTGLVGLAVWRKRRKETICAVER